MLGIQNKIVNDKWLDQINLNIVLIVIQLKIIRKLCVVWYYGAKCFFFNIFHLKIYQNNFFWTSTHQNYKKH
jgi:hypothetical protein